MSERRPRVVLLGASNLTRGVATAVAAARRHVAGPFDAYAALGHGRAYATPSRVLLRGLCAIVDCGLWDALASDASRPTIALVTDVGNDLVYGASPAATMDALAACVSRLETAGARPVVTRLPTDALRDLPRWRFELVRRVLFPRSPLRHRAVIDDALDLDARVAAFATARGLPLVAMDPAWFGFDPIHIRRRARREAWTRMTAAWTPDGPPHPLVRGSRSDRRRLRRATPAAWTLAGRRRRTPQPAARLRDGTTVSLY